MSFSSNNFLLQLKPYSRSYRVYDDQLPGLFLEILPSGQKKWRLRFTADGRQHQNTLGNFPKMTARQARVAGKASLLTAPDLAGSAHCNEPTFGQLAQLWLDCFSQSRRNLDFRLSERLLNSTILPALGSKVLTKLSGTDIIIEVLAPLLEGGDIEGAQRAKRLLRQIFRFGFKKALVKSDPTVGLPESVYRTVTGQATPNIDPDDPVQLPLFVGQEIEAKPGHYNVKRNPLLIGLPFDPSQPGQK
ncbi:MAG: Arm DNA-binding domain-containing protein [Deltaproteobacteria bacterium]|nr:Arm DNA-binding domain-containing protein [Deltaproteobacteria bacterium]